MGTLSCDTLVLSHDREANLCQVVRRAPLRRINTRWRSQQMVHPKCQAGFCVEGAAEYQSHWMTF